MIDEDLAAGTKSMLALGLSNEAKQKIFDKYDVPENCQRLNVIKCNENIWLNASKERRQNDAQVQETQKGILKSLTILNYAFDFLTISNDPNRGIGNSDAQHLSDLMTDAIGVLADCSHDLDIKRRQQFRLEFKEEYNSLCNDKYPVEEFLFGPYTAVCDKVKGVSETIKLQHRVSRKHEPYKAAYSQRKQQRQDFRRAASQHSYSRGGYSNFSNTNKNYNNKKKTSAQQPQYPQPKNFSQGQRR